MQCDYFNCSLYKPATHRVLRIQWQIVQARCLSAWKTRHLSIPPTFLLSLLSFPDTSSLDALAKNGKGVEMYQNIIMHGKRSPPNPVL